MKHCSVCDSDSDCPGKKFLDLLVDREFAGLDSEWFPPVVLKGASTELDITKLRLPSDVSYVIVDSSKMRKIKAHCPDIPCFSVSDGRYMFLTRND